MKKAINFVLAFVMVSSIMSCTTPSEDGKISSTESEKSEDINLSQKIFSTNDFETYSKQENSVINKLSKEAITNFKEHLKFGKNGKLATAKFTMIEQELSTKEVEIFWAYFGYTRAYIADHKYYKCIGNHNCKSDSEYICLDGC